jgi:polyferredoxin
MTSDFFRRHLRQIVQFAFLALIVFIGVEFMLFVAQVRQHGPVTITRPPGVEGFLPISGLINLKYWLLTGEFTLIHPAAAVLLLVFMTIALLLKKGFCSWICPIGLLSDYLARIHGFFFNRPVHLPAWLDYPLRSLKYFLLLFFIYAVFIEMDATTLQRFIFSPYNRVADVKMLLFFSQASWLTIKVLLALVLLSTLLPYFWCRYLCPYGALLGFLSLASPLKIRRNPSTCIDCGKCTKVCPAGIRVQQKSAVWSDECHACFRCVDVCPVNHALQASTKSGKIILTKKIYAGILVLLFVLAVGVARVAGVWRNSISHDEYRHHLRNLNSPAYQHNRGQVPDENPVQSDQAPSGSIR